MKTPFELPRLFRENPYAFTGLLLSPALDPGTEKGLRRCLRVAVDWGDVLRLANLHFCTPLLYVRLRQHGLLSDLPTELVAYLQCLHAASSERNESFRSALIELVRIARDLRIDCLLLKGAATFCDDLYGDPGARMMGDLDILVRPPDASRLQKALLVSGYEERPRQERDRHLFTPSFDRYHLPRLFRQGSPVEIEIHWESGAGQAGRGVPASMLWQGMVTHDLEGLTVSLPDPTSRILHATFHALVPNREFIRSAISLAHLAEFGALLKKYGNAIRLEEWESAGAAQGLGREFAIFRDLEALLMSRPGASRWTTNVQIIAGRRRILAAGENLLCSEADRGVRKRWKRAAIVLWTRCFYWRKVPAWIWNNYCYMEGYRNLPSRLRILMNRIVRRTAPLVLRRSRPKQISD